MERFKNYKRQKGLGHKIAIGFLALLLVVSPAKPAHAFFGIEVSDDTGWGDFADIFFMIWYTLTIPIPGNMNYDMVNGFASVVEAINATAHQTHARIGQAGIDQQRIETVTGRDADLLAQANVAPKSIACQTVRAGQVAGASESASRGATIQLVDAAMNEGRRPASPPPTSLKWKSIKLCALWCEGFINTQEYNGISFGNCTCP